MEIMPTQTAAPVVFCLRYINYLLSQVIDGSGDDGCKRGGSALASELQWGSRGPGAREVAEPQHMSVVYGWATSSELRARCKRGGGAPRSSCSSKEVRQPVVGGARTLELRPLLTTTPTCCCRLPLCILFKICYCSSTECVRTTKFSSNLT
jgi:hypothetical protein